VALLSLRTGRIAVAPEVSSAWKNFRRRGRKEREDAPDLDFRAKERSILRMHFVPEAHRQQRVLAEAGTTTIRPLGWLKFKF
jgi:hypothetical protein